MSNPLRVLLIEDSEDDALLLVHELRRGGYEPTWERVDTATGLSAALQRQAWDLITCDYAMPQFSAPAALRLLAEAHIDLPIIIVSGEVGEEVAVTAMKAGAHDFVSKHKLARLVPAVDRELREAQGRRAHRQIEQAYRTVVEESLQGMAILQDSKVVFVNPALSRMSGYGAAELLAMPPEQLVAAVHPEDRPFVFQWLRAHLAGVAEPPRLELRIYRKDGSLCWVELQATRIEYRGRPALQFAYVDVTDRKRAEEALQHSEARLREQLAELDQVYKTAPVGLGFVDRHLRYVRVNQQLAAMNGRRAEEHIGRTVGEIIPQCAAEVEALCRRVLDFREPQIGVECRGAASADPAEQRARLSSYYPVATDDGTVLGVNIVVLDITERKRSEEAIRASERQYRSLVEISQDVIWSVDTTGRCTFANRAIKALLGYEPAEVLGRPFTDFMRMEWRGESLGLFERTKTGGKLFGPEVELLRKDGAPVIVTSNAVALRDEQGHVVGATGTLLDITERKRAEEALRESEQKYRDLVETSHDVIWSVDRLGRFTFLNQAVKPVLGYEPREMVGRQFVDFMRPQKVGDSLRIFDQIVAGNNQFGYEAEFLRQDGTPILFSSNAVVLRDGHGRFMGATGTAIDITEREQVDQALRESEARFRALADAVPVMIWVTGLDGRCTYFNRRWLAFTERRLDQELGFGWAENVHPNDLQRIVDTYLKAFDTREDLAMQYRLRRADGEYRWVLNIGVPYFSPSDTFLGYVGSCIECDRAGVVGAITGSSARDNPRRHPLAS